MIVVIGLPAYVDSPDGERCAGGLAVEVASAARQRGSTVELVGKVGNDGAGDAVVVALGRFGIGHAALLRDPILPTPVLATSPGSDDDAEVDAEVSAARLLPENVDSRPGLEAADVELALKFLPAPNVVVLADAMSAATTAAGVEGAAFSAAKLVVLVPAGATPPVVPAEATVLEAPLDDDGSFGRLVGAFAGALDAGVDAGSAFTEAVKSAGWEPAAE
jgi:hypothetical protein